MTRWNLAATLLLLSAAATRHEGATEGTVQVGEVGIYYRTVGEGEPFVVLHGGPGMYHDELYPFFLDFARSHQIIFYDQRGNGRSPLENVDASVFSVDLLVEDLEALRTSLDLGKLNIIGHSWGGLLAMYYATAYPENVDRLITVSSAPVNSDLLVKCYMRLIDMLPAGDWERLQRIYESAEYLDGDPAAHNEAMRISEGATFYDKSWIDPYMEAAAFDQAKAKNAVALADLAREMKLNITVQEHLDRIQCDVLIVQGREDFVVPESAELAAELIAGAEIAWIDECGHYPHVEAADRFFAVLEDFIERTR